MPRLEHKVALVTGAARGIGAATLRMMRRRPPGSPGAIVNISEGSSA